MYVSEIKNPINWSSSSCSFQLDEVLPVCSFVNPVNAISHTSYGLQGRGEEGREGEGRGEEGREGEGRGEEGREGERRGVREGEGRGGEWRGGGGGGGGRGEERRGREGRGGAVRREEVGVRGKEESLLPTSALHSSTPTHKSTYCSKWFFKNVDLSSSCFS